MKKRLMLWALRWLIDRLGPPVKDVPPSRDDVPPPPPDKSAPLTDRIVHFLRGRGEVHVWDIGNQFRGEVLSSTLPGMAKRGRIVRVRRGWYALPEGK